MKRKWCHGTGKNAAEYGPVPCPDCRGTGWLDENENDESENKNDENEEETETKEQKQFQNVGGVFKI